MFLRKLLRSEAYPIEADNPVCHRCKVPEFRRPLYKANGLMVGEYVTCMLCQERFGGRRRWSKKKKK